MKDHDRLLLVRQGFEAKLKKRRGNSKLPALMNFMMARPLASAGMIAAELFVTPRAAQDMVNGLGLRELTGRGRYRAWGIRFFLKPVADVARFLRSGSHAGQVSS
jgi:predicted transcriptional regulator